MKVTKSRAMEAAAGSGGICTEIGRRLNISRQHVHRLRGKWPDLDELIISERESLVDEAEQCLRDQIAAGSVTAAIFTLKCLGRGRGWIEKTAVDITTEDKPQPVREWRFVESPHHIRRLEAKVAELESELARRPAA